MKCIDRWADNDSENDFIQNNVLSYVFDVHIKYKTILKIINPEVIQF